jgi:hypothetical protein
MKYLVLIGDIVASRELPARAQFQRRLKGVLQTLNGRRKTLVSPYTLTLGDEFQAVYRDAETVFADAFAVLAEIAPVQARFALAVGEIVTPINPAQAIGMDGPAFHRARSRLEQLKADRRLLGVEGGARAWTLPAAALAVLSGQMEGWRANRFGLFARILAGEPAGELDEWKRILDEITRLLNLELKS